MLNSPLGGRRGVGFGLGRSWQRGGFLPTDIAGLQLWLDFSDASTLFVDAGITPVSADGDEVRQANDKSGNNNNFNSVLNTSLYKPAYKTNIQNGLSALYFAGNNEGLLNTSMNLVSAITTFIVMKSDNTNSNYIATFGGNDNAYIQNYVVGKVAWWNSRVVIADIETTKLINAYTTTGSSISGTWSVGFNVGNADGHEGHIAEHIVYSGTLAAGDITRVNNYLQNKWNLT